MAAKQGLTAQLSQSAEDAKRAVLSRTPLYPYYNSSSNTVCTIKSAPPKSPDVLKLLATKSGWLYKRNEQHVWQKRWCCVVPHMFLYYFDAVEGGDSDQQQYESSSHHTFTTTDDATTPASLQLAPSPILPPSQQQADWNAAIAASSRKPQDKRRPFNLFQHTSTAAVTPEDTTTTEAEATEAAEASAAWTHDTSSSSHLPPLHPPNSTATTPNDSSSSSNLQQQQQQQQHQTPAGIIDLECYTAIHRFHKNPLLLELSGDDAVNPDLRAFYFKVFSQDEVEDWTHALLQQRHTHLQDECSAYKQVCDGFCQQLQQLHTLLDEAQLSTQEQEKEVYRVRSQMEESRRTLWNLLLDAFATPEQQQQELLEELETIRRQDMGLAAAVRAVCDYALQQDLTISNLKQETTNLHQQLQTTGRSDTQKVESLEEKVATLQNQVAQQQEEHAKHCQALQTKLEQSQKQLMDLQKENSHTKLELSMAVSQFKQQRGTLVEHKRVLKQEVLELRAKVQDTSSQRDTITREVTSAQLALEQERQKTRLLERYVEKMESQVQVQQNMMEYMSHSGGASVARGVGPASVVGMGVGGGSGGGGGAAAAASLSPPSVDDNDFLPPLRQQTSIIPTSPTNDVDNISHVSALTEDRTQRQFLEAAAFDHHLQQQQHQSRRQQQHQQHPSGLFTTTTGAPPLSSGSYSGGNSFGPIGPPSYIIGGPNRRGSGGGGSGSSTSHHSAGKNNPQQQQQQQSRQQQQQNLNTSLETIHSSAMSLPPPGRPYSSSGGNAHHSHHHMHTPPQYVRKGSSNSVSSIDRPFSMLSVAQRARMDADRQSTPVRVRVDDKLQASLDKRSRNNSRHSSSSSLQNDWILPLSTNGSQPSGLWRRMEEAVLGPRPEDMLSDDNDDDDDDDGSSVRSTRVTDYTDDHDDHHNGHVRQHHCSPPHIVEEKKQSDSSVSNLSLQERSRLQREQQLKFLKEQGLIKTEQDVRGGAGASSPSPLAADGGSVTSTNISFPQSPMSFASVRNGSRQ